MNSINVGMGEIHVSKTSGTVLIAPGLGSCIGLVIYDPIQKVGGMAHVVLPDSSSAKSNNSLAGKYADIAIPELLNKLYALGALKCNLIVKIAGGAQMFNLDRGGNILNIGVRNVTAVKEALAKERLEIKASDTGGNTGRTLKFDVSSGKIYVKSIGQPEGEL
jgi:chemotaxis protein CheD